MFIEIKTLTCDWVYPTGATCKSPVSYWEPGSCKFYCAAHVKEREQAINDNLAKIIFGDKEDE